MKSPPSNEIYYSDPLIVKCEGTLKGWTKALALTRKPRAFSGQPFYCEIDASKSQEAIIEERTNSARALPLLPLDPSPSESVAFTFGIRLRFDMVLQGKYSLTSASVSIFSGRRLSPLARAEWDRRDVGKSTHAQPHWHLLQIPEDTTFISEQEPSTTKEFNPDHFTGPAGRVHFPMLAKWHEEPCASVQRDLTTEDELKNWLTGLTAYMRAQLGYAGAKTGPLIQEF